MRRDSVGKMKTLDEVIKAKELCALVDYGDDSDRCPECPYAKKDEHGDLSFFCGDCEEDALHYLREYRKLDSLDAVAFPEDDNPALTWDELKQMEGKPVWMEQCNGDTKGWLLILRTNYDVINCTTKHGNSFYLYKSSYGKTWQAYRKERV